MILRTNKQKDRYNRMMPNDKPRYVRCYDNNTKENGTFDRYTVVFTGHYTGTCGQRWYVGMSQNPFHPQGIGSHGESDFTIDYPSYKHLGKKIRFDDLPDDCKALTIQTYLYLWDITDENGNPLN